MDEYKIDKFIELLQAYKENKTIQRNTIKKGKEVWQDIDNPIDSYLPKDWITFRVKPEPYYEPFDNADDCWKEMLKHKPFGWIKGKAVNSPKECILGLNSVTVELNNRKYRNYAEAFRLLEFIDGHPFGKLLDEN